MLVEVAKTDEIAPGGMKAVEANGEEIVLCNDGGAIFAVGRRCGHMSAPLDQGALEGYILTCPFHHAQFDITTGEALSGPVPADLGDDPVPEALGRFLKVAGTLMSHIKTCNIKPYTVKLDGDRIKVEV
jgi:nitrite reductase/ring-hydroxylating ferredoxin subunit